MNQKDLFKRIGIIVFVVASFFGHHLKPKQLDVASKKIAGYGGSAYGI